MQRVKEHYDWKRTSDTTVSFSRNMHAYSINLNWVVLVQRGVEMCSDKGMRTYLFREMVYCFLKMTVDDDRLSEMPKLFVQQELGHLISPEGKKNLQYSLVGWKPFRIFPNQ